MLTLAINLLAVTTKEFTGLHLIFLLLGVVFGVCKAIDGPSKRRNGPY